MAQLFATEIYTTIWTLPIYPRMNLSKRQKKAQILPYLLKNVDYNGLAI